MTHFQHRSPFPFFPQLHFFTFTDGLVSHWLPFQTTEPGTVLTGAWPRAWHTCGPVCRWPCLYIVTPLDIGMFFPRRVFCLFTESIGVTLVNRISQVSGAQFFNTVSAPVLCSPPRIKSPSITIYPPSMLTTLILYCPLTVSFCRLYQA